MSDDFKRKEKPFTRRRNLPTDTPERHLTQEATPSSRKQNEQAGTEPGSRRCNPAGENNEATEDEAPEGSAGK